MSHIGGYGLAYYQRCFAQRSISAKLTLLFLNIFVAIADGVFLYKKKYRLQAHISGYVLDIYLAMPKCNVASAPNITLELTKFDNLLTPIVFKIYPCYF